MRLNHINLAVDDVPAAKTFLERYFGLRACGEAHQNFQMLLDEEGLVLTLMGVGRANTVSYPKTFHIGFILPTVAQVQETHARLLGDGFDVEAPSQKHGAWTFSFQAPGGFMVGVRSEPSQPRSGSAEETASGERQHEHASRHTAHG